MKKIIYLMLLIISTFLVFNYKVFAKCSCTYSSGNLDGSFAVESDGTASKINLTGSIENSTDSSSHNINKNVSIDNWKKEWSWQGSNFTFYGKKYYEQTGLCPSYLYVIDMPINYMILVSDKKSSEVEDYLKKVKKEGTPVQGVEILTLHESSDCKSNNNSVSGSTSAAPNPSACIGKTRDTCKIDFENSVYCAWNEKYNFCSTTGLLYTRCGDSYDIPKQAPEIISLVITFLKILTPILLIIIGIISLVKALGASSEDEIKKAQGKLIKRFISAIMVFLVISIVQFVINKVADDSEKDSISKCLSCLLDNNCDDITYYRIDENTCVNYYNNQIMDFCPESE